jgi:hypothetical protein
VSIRHFFRAGLLVFAAMVVPACSGDDNSGPESPDYDPEIPAAWAAAVSNSLFPLEPGTSWEFSADTEDGLETVVVEVLSETKTINGVVATVVHDRAYLDGELTEDTFDWYAQDAAGNVWYLGEDTKEYEDGAVVSTEGSWEWGVNGALPGIIMWADPAAHVDEAYRQEFEEDVAEDWGKVVALDQAVTVPWGSFTGCVKTEDWNDLEPGVVEDKYYCAGLGVVLEVEEDGTRVELVGVEAP